MLNAIKYVANAVKKLRSWNILSFNSFIEWILNLNTKNRLLTCCYTIWCKYKSYLSQCFWSTIPIQCYMHFLVSWMVSLLQNRKTKGNTDNSTKGVFQTYTAFITIWQWGLGRSAKQPFHYQTLNLQQYFVILRTI